MYNERLMNTGDYTVTCDCWVQQ